MYIDEISKLTPEYLEELELLYNPERVLMEWNGMWNPEGLKLPADWDLYQQITIVDGSSSVSYTHLIYSTPAGASVVVVNLAAFLIFSLVQAVRQGFSW